MQMYVNVTVTGCFNGVTDPCQAKMTAERSLKGHL